MPIKKIGENSMRVLIFTASTGGGHKRAAAALEAKIKALSKENSVKVVDGLKEVGKVYDDTVCHSYHFMATKIPKVYGISYSVTDRKNLISSTVMRSNKIMARRLLSSIDEFMPDVIIACHPFITGMLGSLKKHKKIEGIKTISLITDYDSHRTYINSYIDAYVLAVPSMAEKLINEYGVAKEKIYPLGIPIFDSFTEPYDKEKICEREGLDPNKPTVLLMAGSFGVNTVLEFYKGLALKSKDIQFIIITGRNIKLFGQLDKLIDEIGAYEYTKLLYFVRNVQDYMHISDLIITKPGGLTVTESLACKLPLAIYSAFPGQERDNADFLVGENAAVLLDKENEYSEIIDLLNNKEKLEAMRDKCSELAQPDSAENIFRLAEKLCKEK